MYRTLFPSPLGEIYCSIDDGGALCELYFLAYRPRGREGATDDPAHAAGVIRQVDEYFAGSRRVFDLPVAPVGSVFQQRVWKELRTIPFGATVSYGELAARLGNENGPRAVGRANATNPVSLIIPCHRVIGADGSLTGYGGGLPIKEVLLRWEGVALPRIGREVLTIGHSNHSMVRFVELLRRHQVTAVADTRSQPYSRHVPQFNQAALAGSLEEAGIRYVYLGAELGGKPARPERFPGGLLQLMKGAVDHRIAVLCAEENPENCHRGKLIAPELERYGIAVLHIRGDGGLEPSRNPLPLFA